jgi:hypothetical protein
MHRKDDDDNSHKLKMIPNQIKTQKEKKQLLLYRSKSSLPPSLPPPPPPPPAATASTSPVTMWTGTTTLSHLDWNYYSPRHLEWNLWNSGTAAAVAATFVSLQLGAFEHH